MNLARIGTFEVVVLGQIFGRAGLTRARALSELRRDSGAIVRPIHEQLYRDLVDARYFLASPDTVRTVWQFAGLLIAGFVYLLFQLETASFPAMLAGVASGASGLSRVSMPRLFSLPTMPYMTARITTKVSTAIGPAHNRLLFHFLSISCLALSSDASGSLNLNELALRSNL